MISFIHFQELMKEFFALTIFYLLFHFTKAFAANQLFKFISQSFRLLIQFHHLTALLFLEFLAFLLVIVHIRFCTFVYFSLAQYSNVQGDSFFTLLYLVELLFELLILNFLVFLRSSKEFAHWTHEEFCWLQSSQLLIIHCW